jgi:hypothetical protein
MSDVCHSCVYCYYNSCYGNAAKWFLTVWDNDYRTVCVYYTVVIVILLRGSRSYDLHCWKFIICKSGLLDFVHCLYFNKITTFRKLDLLPSSGEKGRTETLAVGSPGWASLRPGPGITHSRIQQIYGETNPRRKIGPNWYLYSEGMGKILSNIYETNHCRWYCKDKCSWV